MAGDVTSEMTMLSMAATPPRSTGTRPVARVPGTGSQGTEDERGRRCVHCAQASGADRHAVAARATVIREGLATRGVHLDGSASAFITAALVCYTIGVWSERIQGRLKPWHLAFFWLGLACDTVGTGMMFDFAGGLTADVHGISGVIAIVLMLVHAIWASVVLARRDERWIVKFHRFSLVVWVIWLVPYFSPMFFAMAT